MSKYKLVKGPDNITWLSLEPLLDELKLSIVEIMKMDLPLEEEEERNHKLMGLRATFEILSELVNQSNRETYSGVIDVSKLQ